MSAVIIDPLLHHAHHASSKIRISRNLMRLSLFFANREPYSTSSSARRGTRETCQMCTVYYRELKPAFSGFITCPSYNFITREKGHARKEKGELWIAIGLRSLSSLTNNSSSANKEIWDLRGLSELRTSSHKISTASIASHHSSRVAVERLSWI